MNKRGWIRIVEAFIALMLITGALLIVINKGYIGKKDISEQVYSVQIAVLREIQLDDDLRASILNIKEDELPVEWKDFENYGLEEVKNKIIERTPEYLYCEGKICKLDVVCSQEEFVERDVYAQSVAIAANLEKYSPRQLKLFCWVRD